MKDDHIKAIILAAGKGNRMQPYTKTYQKTMIPLHGKPLLEYIIEGVIHAGLNDIIIVVGYKKEQIMAYFGNGSKWGINITYVVQENLNGTGGALLLCEGFVKESHFFLTWGDILVPYKVYAKVVKTFKEEGEDFILVTNYMEDLQKGCAIIPKDGYCMRMVEKPSKDTINSKLNNCGIFILSKEIFEILRFLSPSERGEIELPEAINLGIDTRKWNVRIHRMAASQFRGDFGDLEVYEKLKNDKSWLDKVY